MPVLVEDANAAITQGFSDLVHLIAIVPREREMVSDQCAFDGSQRQRAHVASEPGQDEPVQAPTPPSAHDWKGS